MARPDAAGRMVRWLVMLVLPLLAAGCVLDQNALDPPAAQQAAERAPPAGPVQRAADREHQRLLAAFGGEYRAPQMRALLADIVARLAKAGDGEIGNYEITILDSPAVNAFALPNGRLYVTRGLLALANDTAEVASVLAHEIAHVTARHAVERAELELESALVSQVVSHVLNDPVAGAAVSAGSRLSLARFSRQQELAADQISVRNIARAGYDPYGAPRFLAALGRNTGFRSGAAQGQSKGEKALDILSTHPSTPERIAAATNAARQIGAPGIGERESGRWLGALDGIAFGEDPANGVVRGRSYVNSTLRIAFSAPRGFDLEAARDMVVGASADGVQAMRFDSVALQPGQTLESYVASGWIEGVTTGEVRRIALGELEAAVTAGRGTDWRFSLAAIQIGPRVYRFIVAARQGGDPEPTMRMLLDGFRHLSPAEAQALRPLRIRLLTAGAGDTATTLAERMGAVDRPLEQFQILNGLDRGARLVPGQRYKIVGE